MAGPETEIMFDGVSEVLGADLYLSDGTTQRLDKARLEEPLFHSVSEDATASAGQVLTGFFAQTGTGPRDYVGRETLDEAIRQGTATSRSTLEVRFGDPSIQFKQGDALAEIDRLTFDLQLTVTPHKNA